MIISVTEPCIKRRSLIRAAMPFDRQLHDKHCLPNIAVLIRIFFCGFAVLYQFCWKFDVKQ